MDSRLLIFHSQAFLEEFHWHGNYYLRIFTRIGPRSKCDFTVRLVWAFPLIENRLVNSFFCARNKYIEKGLHIYEDLWDK